MIKLIVLGLRGASIGARFLLSFLIVKNISLEFQGEYSLLLTTITVLMLVAGFDFYVYSNRFVIKHREQTSHALINQLSVHILTYCVLFLIFLILYAFDITSQYISITVIFLLVFEHLGMEFFRTFIAIEKVFIANIILFVRTGTWPIVLIYQLVFTPQEITMKLIITYWLIASVFSVILGFIFIYKEVIGQKFSIDIKWIKKGLKVASLFFVATMAQKIIEFSDRYIIDAFLGAKSLGIYSFYFQLANVVNVVIFTIFISFMYPKIIYFIDKKKKAEAISVINKLKTYSILFICIYTILLALLLPMLLELVGKTELYDYQIILYLFLLGNLFFNLSFTSHYALVAIERDKELTKIAIGLAIFSCIANIVAVQLIGIIGAVMVFALSSLLLFFVKNKTEKHYFKNYDW